MFCRLNITRSITPAIPPIFPGSARLAASSIPNWRCFPSAPTTLPLSVTCTPVPEDAVRAFLDLKSRWMVPMHYGTFRLSHEPIDEPLQLLEREAQAAGVLERVLVLEEGVTRFF